MTPTPAQLEPGRRVTVVQQIPQRDRVWTIRTTGTVVETAQRKTGSWFAHAKDDRLWLDRLTLRKDDGELIIFNLDGYTHIESEPEPIQSERSADTDTTKTDDEDAAESPADAVNASDDAPADEPAPAEASTDGDDAKSD